MGIFRKKIIAVSSFGAMLFGCAPPELGGDTPLNAATFSALDARRIQISGRTGEQVSLNVTGADPDQVTFSLSGIGVSQFADVFMPNAEDPQVWEFFPNSTEIPFDRPVLAPAPRFTQNGSTLVNLKQVPAFFATAFKYEGDGIWKFTFPRVDEACPSEVSEALGSIVSTPPTQPMAPIQFTNPFFKLPQPTTPGALVRGNPCFDGELIGRFRVPSDNSDQKIQFGEAYRNWSENSSVAETTSKQGGAPLIAAWIMTGGDPLALPYMEEKVWKNFLLGDPVIPESAIIKDLALKGSASKEVVQPDEVLPPQQPTQPNAPGPDTSPSRSNLNPKGAATAWDLGNAVEEILGAAPAAPPVISGTQASVKSPRLPLLAEKSLFQVQTYIHMLMEVHDNGTGEVQKFSLNLILVDVGSENIGHYLNSDEREVRSKYPMLEKRKKGEPSDRDLPTLMYKP